MPKHKQLIDDGYPARWDDEKALPSSGRFSPLMQGMDIIF